MKALLEFILNHLVDHPEDVVVEEEVSEGYSNCIITVHPEDMGKVIGRGGSVIKSIRKLTQVIGVKERIRVNVSIQEPEHPADSTDMASPAPDAEAE